MTTPPPLPSVFDVPLPASGVAYAGRWRRLFAFLLDGILLGVVGAILSWPFFEPLSHVGGWGVAIGCAIAVAYFTLLDGPQGKGQSVGKRIMGIRVVNASGEALGDSNSFQRAFVFCVPFFLNGVILPVSRTPAVVGWVLQALVFTLGGATAYLLLFNGQTRQGLHDLVAQSFVVRDGEPGPLDPKPVWKGHWAILGGLLILLGVGGTLLSKWVSGKGPFPQLLTDVRLVEELPEVETAGVSVQSVYTGSDAPAKRQLIVRILWKGKADAEEDLANRAAAAILEHDPAAAKYDSLRVIVVRGFDLGITSSWRSHVFQHAPAEWD